MRYGDNDNDNDIHLGLPLVQFQTVRYLINLSGDLAIQDQSNQDFFDFFRRYIQLLLPIKEKVVSALCHVLTKSAMVPLQ